MIADCRPGALRRQDPLRGLPRVQAVGKGGLGLMSQAAERLDCRVDRPAGEGAATPSSR